MDGMRYVNLTIVIYSCITTLVIAVCMLLSGGKQTRMNRLVVWVTACQFVVFISDAVALVLEGNVAGYAGPLLYGANLLVYVFGFLLLPVFTDYLISYLSERARINRSFVRMMYGLCFLNLAMIGVAQIGGKYFYIDAANHYHRGEWFWFSQVFAILAMAVNIVLTIGYHKRLSRSEFGYFLAYELLPVAALILQALIDGPYFMNVGTSTALVLLYAGVYLEQDKYLAQKTLELNQSRQAIMLSQIQPHFLYNALTAIAMLCELDPPRAKKTIIGFSDYLRGNMDSLKQQDLIPFEEELSHTKVYLELEHLRFEDELRIEYDIGPCGFWMPCLTLQPIVENAVRYGVCQKDGGGTVIIATRDVGDAHQIVVTDDGVGFDVNIPKHDGRSHIGIDNVRQRLLDQCMGGLEIVSVPGVGTTATITLPKGRVRA